MANSVRLERKDTIAIVILNRPEVLNAVDMEMRETLITLLAELNSAEDVRAVVLTGAGDRAFCSGQDLEEIVRYTVDHIDSWVTRQHAMYAAVRDLDKPCIVAFNGVAAGAGFQIALCADLRIGYPGMKLGQPEIKAGLASIVGSYLMTMHLGLSKNIELSLTGELISGEDGPRHRDPQPPRATRRGHVQVAGPRRRDGQTRADRAAAYQTALPQTDPSRFRCRAGSCQDRAERSLRQRRTAGGHAQIP